MSKHAADPTPETRFAEEVARLDESPEVGGFTFARHRYFPADAIICKPCREIARRRS